MSDDVRMVLYIPLETMIPLPKVTPFIDYDVIESELGELIVQLFPPSEEGMIHPYLPESTNVLFPWETE